MSSQFTHGVVDGTITSLPDFARLCASAFGAPYQDPSTTPPEPPEVDDLFVRNVKTARQKLEYAESWTDDYSLSLAQMSHAQNVKYARDDYNDSTEKYRRVAVLLAQVKAWDPPADFQNLKHFMIDKLNGELHWIGVPKQREPAPQLSGAAYKKQAIQMARRSLEQAGRRLDEEQHRVAAAAKWINDLNQTLDQYEVPA